MGHASAFWPLEEAFGAKYLAYVSDFTVWRAAPSESGRGKTSAEQ